MNVNLIVGEFHIILIVRGFSLGQNEYVRPCNIVGKAEYGGGYESVIYNGTAARPVIGVIQMIVDSYLEMNLFFTQNTIQTNEKRKINKKKTTKLHSRANFAHQPTGHCTACV